MIPLTVTRCPRLQFCSLRLRSCTRQGNRRDLLLPIYVKAHAVVEFPGHAAAIALRAARRGDLATVDHRRYQWPVRLRSLVAPIHCRRDEGEGCEKGHEQAEKSKHAGYRGSPD